MGCTEIIAHITGNGKSQTLLEHAEAVAELASGFASEFNNADWAVAAAMWHDLGKADSLWQKYIRGEGQRTINHSEAGAQYAYCNMQTRKPLEKTISYLIAGHHAGLPDWYAGSGKNLKSIFDRNDYEEIIKIPEIKDICDFKLPSSMPFGLNKPSPDLFEHLHLWVRMLYSCLVDADFLDTERFMNPEQFKLRGKFVDLTELRKRFDVYMNEKTAHTQASRLNEIRVGVLASCRKKARCKPGFFSLNVPTGGGKTLSSMAFALEHALAHNRRRIIVAIPYTSIIEQTAKVYKYGTDVDMLIEEYKKQDKYLFGEENVLEHHSNFDFDKKNEADILQRQKLATENWDAPVIVTTNVQLFESLFNAHSAHCRKLHNIVNSIIILDEVQMLPPDYLKSILSVLRGLVEYFGVTVVLCTATQPAFEGTIGSDTARFDGIPRDLITPIIDNPEKLAKELKRVKINTDYVREKIPDWKSLANKLCDFEQVLCIVSTRKDCRDLHALMPLGTIHLSALMCPEERSEIISDIKNKLRNGETVRVISTQLVECGVDMDFPVVFRALAGMDSIAQAAGRCNREGNIKDLGVVYVFSPPSRIPSGLLRKGADATKSILEKYDYKVELTPELYKEYFTLYFGSVNDFDKPDFESSMKKESKYENFQFRTLSDAYHLIDSSYQGSVIIRYTSPKTGKSNAALIDRLIADGPDRTVMRKLGRYSVNLPLKEITQLLEKGRLIQPFDDITVYVQNQTDRNLYQPGLGLVADSLESFGIYIF